MQTSNNCLVCPLHVEPPNGGWCSGVALIDFCVSSDTMSCLLTGNANTDEVMAGYITSATTDEVRRWSGLHINNSRREWYYVHLMHPGFTEITAL